MKIYHVSPDGSADGNGNAVAVKSLAAVKLQPGDTLRLQRGATHIGPIPNVPAGCTVESFWKGADPMKVPNPIVLVDAGQAVGLDGSDDLSDITLRDFDIYYPARDPTSRSFAPDRLVPYGNQKISIINYDSHVFRVRSGIKADRFTMRNVGVRFASDGVDLQGANGVVIDGCSFEDIYGNDDKANGTYLSRCDNVTISNTTYDRIGWNAATMAKYPRTKPTVLSHGIYAQDDNGPNFNLHHNGFTDCASHGFQLRSGGNASYNLIRRCALAGLVAKNKSVLHANVAIYGRDIQPGVPALARGAGFEVQEVPDIEVTDNFFLDKTPGVGLKSGAAYTVRFTYNRTPPKRVVHTGNIISEWPGVKGGVDYSGPLGWKLPAT